MGRSVLRRQLTLALSVAALAVLATSLSAVSDTGSLIQPGPGDDVIVTALYAYADEHRGWDGIGPVVRDLAQRTGRRIALTAPDGTLIADSAPAAGTGSGDLPPPVARIDATGPRPASAPVRSVDAGRTLVVATHADPLGWQLTDGEIADRRRLADSAAQCLRDAGIEASFRIGPTWQVFASAPPASGVTAAEVSTHPCVPPDLLAPSAAAVELAATATELAAECLDQHSLGHAVTTSTRGLPELRPIGDTPPSEAWTACTEAARAEAKKAHVAPPAALHLGSGPLSPDPTWRAAATAGAVMLTAALLAVLAARRLVRPLRAVTAAAARIADGDFSARVPTVGDDDVNRVARAFNAMAASVERSDRQRTATINDIAHELRGPLTNVRGRLEAAETGVLPLDPTLLRSVQAECDLLARLVTDLQDLTLADAGRLPVYPEECDAADIAAQAVAAHEAPAEAAGARVQLHAPEPAPVLADPARLHQALGNLIANAITHNPPGTVVDVAVRTSGTSVLLTVNDNGPGIPSEHLARIFDRFYRVDSFADTARGLGLGLAIATHIAEAHGGRLEVTSRPGNGSAFTIRLPCP